MKKTNLSGNRLSTLVLTCALLASLLATPYTFSVQPPVQTGTYYFGRAGQPRRLDPACAYDTLSCDVIMNVYEPLFFFSDKKLAPTPDATGFSNVTSEYWSDLSQFGPVLATALPTIDSDNKTWHFFLNTSAVWQNYTLADGTLRSGVHVSVADVVYTFQRMLVQDQVGAPTWMFCLPGTGHRFFNELDTNSSTNTIEPLANERLVAKLIQQFVYPGLDVNEIIFNFTSSWPRTALMQIFAQTWGGIVNQEFCIEHGCWNGTWADGWSTVYRQKPSSLYSPLDRYYSGKSKYTPGSAGEGKNSGGTAGDVPTMCGTGPYKYTSWDKANKIWRIDRWAGYWRDPTFANAGEKNGNFISTVIEEGVENWETRKMLFLTGEFDECEVPRSRMYDLLEPGTDFDPIEGINLYYGYAGLSNEMALFVFTLDPSTPYMPKIQGAAVPDFFGNAKTRSAFTYALNYTSYVADAYFGEVFQVDSWWVDGLTPDYRNYALTHKNLNVAKIQSDLQAAYYPAISNTSSLWDLGFETYLCYNLGNDQRKIACDMIAQTINSLSPTPGKFKVNVVGLDWSVFLDYEELMYMPMFFVGWFADFADADNFARPYMHSNGDFAYYQGYSNSTVDSLIDQAIITPNENVTRGDIYRELQREYYDSAIGLPLVQFIGRRWCRDWLKGWYFNQLYPGFYYYDIYKKAPTLLPIDLDVTSTITPVVSYNKFYYYLNGTCYVGNGNRSEARFVYRVHVKRLTDASGLATVLAAVGVRRTLYDKTNPSQILMTDFVNATTVPLANGQDKSITLDWWEDGSLPARFASDVWWNMSAEIGHVTSLAYDTNLANNKVHDGATMAVSLVFDLRIDGRVNILDFIAFACVWGKNRGETGWRDDADLIVDGKINILDVIMAAWSWGKHAP